MRCARFECRKRLNLLASSSDMASRARRMYDLKFVPQKTAQIPISHGDEASFSDKFRAKSKDSDLAPSKAARSQDAQTAHGQNFNGARRLFNSGQEALGGAQKGPSDTLASGGEGILKFRPSSLICPRSPLSRLAPALLLILCSFYSARSFDLSNFIRSSSRLNSSA